MDGTLVGETWDRLGDRHAEFFATFYRRLFERHPEYARHFPRELDSHMKKMVRTMTMVARVSENAPVVGPHLELVGQHHRTYHLGHADLVNFKDVFLDVLQQYCAGEWTPRCREAWDEAFEQTVIPMMEHGLGEHRARA